MTTFSKRTLAVLFFLFACLISFGLFDNFNAFNAAAFSSPAPLQAQPIVSILNDVSANEGSPLSFNVRLSSPSTQQVTVNIATSNLTAAAGSDYNAVNTTLTFSTGQTSLNVVVPTIQDNIDELDEDFNITLSNAVNANISPGDFRKKGTILNDDPPPNVSINNPPPVNEGNAGTANITFNVVLSAPSGKPVRVDFATVNGTATAPSDFINNSGAVNFPLGSTVQSITVIVNSDLTVEPNETFTVTISNPLNATIVGSGQGVGMILNDDAPPPTVTVDNQGIIEGDSGKTDLVFTVKLSGPSAQQATVAFNTVNGTAIAPGDYTSVSGTLTFPPGSTAQTIAVPINGDNINEIDEEFLVNLSNPSNAVIPAGGGRAAGKINNDDPQPSISISDVRMAEGNSSKIDFIFAATLSAPSGRVVEVDFATADDTAKAGTDYTSNSGKLIFVPGSTSQPIRISVNGDADAEPDENFTVNLSNSINATISKGRGVGTIANDDSQQQQPSISINDVRMPEGNAGRTDFVFIATLSSASNQPVTVRFDTADATAAAPGDYASNSGTATFPAGSTSQNIVIAVNGDAMQETDETFFVKLSSPNNATINKGQGTGTIANDDAQTGMPSLSINDPRIVEGNSGTSNLVFAVTLSSASNQTVMVNFATANGTAASPSDYVGNNGTIAFQPGTTMQTISITINGDTAIEPDETFFVDLSSPVNAAITKGRGTGVITNDDAQSAPPTLAINDVKMVEGNSGTNRAVFAVVLSRPSAQPVTVNFATADGSATAGSDYVAASGPLTFNPGMVTQTIAITINGDTAVEPDETFTINLSNPANAAIMKGQGAAVIINDDSVGGSNQPSISINEAKAQEGDSGTSGVTLTVTLSRAAQQPVTVDFSTMNGNAAAGSDYVDARGALTFAPGATMQTVRVTINGDVMVEPDEVFFVVLSNPTNAVIGNGRGAALIQNDDGGGLPSLSINDVRVNEGNSGTTNAVFTVNLSSAAKQQVTVAFAAVDGSATAGSDYVADRRMLSFQPGATTQTISIAINADAMPEPDEAFFVVLMNPVNATIGKERGAGVIINDDAAVAQSTLEFSDPNYRVDEGAVKAVITVVRSGSSAGRVSVNFTTRNGAALANSDYAPLFGTIVFNDGDMNPKTFIVAVLDDNTVERDEFLVLVLMNPMGGARIGQQDMALLNINDDDTSNNPILRVERTIDFGAVASSDTAVRAVNITNAGGGSLNFTLTLADGSNAGFSIDSQPSSFTLNAGETISFNAAFKSTSGGLAVGAIAVTSNGGNALIRLLASSDATPPSVTLTSPSGGETVIAGQPFTIRFSGSDDELAGFLISLSTDGGATFTSEIARVGPDASSAIWNVPDSLDTTQAVIQAAARDRSGNIASDISGTFAVQKSQSNAAMLQVVLSFDPPGDDQLTPPQNLVVTVSDSSSNSTLGAAGLKKKKIKSNVDAAPTDVIGYNIFRAAIPEDGSATPTSDEIVNDPNNLVGSTTGDSITFMDTASTSNGNNFVYSATSYFGNGQQSSGSNTASTDLPVIKNAKYDKGAIFMDSAGSFIATSGAVLIVDDKESYQLATDSTGSRFTVSKKTLSTPSGLKLKKLIKKGSTVTLVVKNPDGKLSLPVMLTRTN